MQSISLALANSVGRGRPIEIPFRKLAERVSFRTGELMVVAGDSGAGKSTLLSNWAWRSPDPILYIAQEDPISVYEQTVQVGLGKSISEVDSASRGYWAERMKGKREELVFHGQSVTLDEIRELIFALTEWLMVPPHIVMVANVNDLKVEGLTHGEGQFFTTVWPGLLRIAIEMDVGVVASHHTIRGDVKDIPGTQPLTLRKLYHGGDRQAQHVWGVYHSEDKKRITVQPLKNRRGQADPGGRDRIDLDWTVEDARLHDVI